jgi:hypothetical protein
MHLIVEVTVLERGRPDFEDRRRRAVRVRAGEHLSRGTGLDDRDVDFVAAAAVDLEFAAGDALVLDESAIGVSDLDE